MDGHGAGRGVDGDKGKKADNGFRAGFQRELEKGMRKMIPSTDILANPHINSKIHVWKKEYGALSDLLSKSGIGWDSSTHTLDIIDESVWDAQKLAGPHVKSMRFKSWPYYEAWLNIFGKDRATGEHASDPMDFVNELLKNVHEEQGETCGYENIFTGETGEEENLFTGEAAGMGANVAGENEKMAENTFVCKPTPLSAGVTSKGKKRKGTMNEMTALVDTLGLFIESTDKSFNTLATRIGPESDAKQSRMSLNDIMKQIPGLSVHAKLKVSDELVQNTARMELFLSLPQDEQVEYVHMLLDGKLGSMP
ncbi:hypothetical protein ACS0TY_029015 [Phlomoides rotata]